MKVYVNQTSITVTGQAWQVLAILKQYKKQFRTVKQWIESAHTCSKNQ